MSMNMFSILMPT